MLPADGIPRDPADAFAQLFDAWATHADVNSLDEWRESHLDEISAAAEAIQAEGEVPDWLVPGPGAEEQFVLLAAIDEALEACHPRTGGGRYGSLGYLATRWA